MAKQEGINNFDYVSALKESSVQPIGVENELKKSFIAYAMAVNVSRAIPDVRDGFKPVHRRILYAMGELNLNYNQPTRKCARIVGDVLGKYHPHGDSAVYDALVRLGQDFTQRYPLVFGQGNFGSVDGDPPAAQRYTEAKLAKIAEEMLRDIDKNTVDFYPNFDNTLMQPTVLPSRFPNILVNGSDGIAVGMATNIPPHNLTEVIDGTIALLNNPDITIDELMKYIQAPDFPMGGIIMGRSGVRNAYKTGRGNVVLRAKCEIEEAEGGRSKIVVTELPYQVIKEQLIKNMADLVKEKRVEGVADIKDYSDRFGMHLEIIVKKDFNPNVVLNLLYKHTQLQISQGMILLALLDGEPRILNLKQILEAYTAHQKDVVTRRTRYDLGKAEERKHIVDGLIIALNNIDEVISIIKKAEDRADAQEKLIARFGLSEKQAQAILDTRLAKLTSLEVEALKKEGEELDALVAEYNDILAKPERIQEIVIKELEEVKETYGDERRTAISFEEGEIDIEDVVEKEEVVISLTHDGYIKRLPINDYKSQRRGGMGVTAHKTKEDDFVEKMFICNTHDDLLVFTTKGKVYKLKAYAVPEAQRQARGRAVVNLIQVDDGEKVNTIIAVKESSEQGSLIMATRSGFIKKTSVKEFESIRQVGKIAIKLAEGDELIAVEFVNGDDEIITATREGKCIRFSEQDVRPMQRDTQGVRSMKLNDGDYVVDMLIVKPNMQVVSITENGYGKRTPLSDYRLQTRAGKGVKAGIFNNKTGKLINIKLINPEEDDIIIISDNGTMIRINADEISMFGRDTQGVRIMKTKEEDKVVSLAVTPKDSEIEEE